MMKKKKKKRWSNKSIEILFTHVTITKKKREKKDIFVYTLCMLHAPMTMIKETREKNYFRIILQANWREMFVVRRCCFSHFSLGTCIAHWFDAQSTLIVPHLASIPLDTYILTLAVVICLQYSPCRICKNKTADAVKHSTTSGWGPMKTL